MEYLPLALAVLVWLKVEAMNADGEADTRFYSAKLAELTDRPDSCERVAATEELRKSTDAAREKAAAADGDLRRKAP
jgi:hypothetical protein